MSEDANDLQLPTTLVIGGKAIDGRTREAKRYKAIVTELISDLGGNASSAQFAVACRCAGLTVMLETLEQEIAMGREVDIKNYTNLTRTLTSSLVALGLGRKSRDTNRPVILDGFAAAVKGGD